MLYISNFVLELINIKLYFKMNRTLIIFLVAALVLISAGLWYLVYNPSMSITDILQSGIILLVVGFALYVGYSRLKSAKRGEPAEDELSKKVMQKTSSASYYISLYLWVFILIIKDRITYDTEELLGYGILGMALIFALCWVFFNFRGIRHE